MVCLMCVAMLAACKENGGETNTTPVSDDATTPSGADTGPTWETDENGYVKDSIPDDTNYGGKVINLLCWTEGLNNVIPKEAGPNEVQEEVYLRRLNLEGRLNINFNVATANGSAQNRDTFLTQARLANESKYDLICSFSLHPSVLAQEGLLYNLNNLQYPQLDMPWWPESITEWEQYGSLYFVASNSSVSTINSMEVMFSNSELFANRELEDPINLVLANEWTVERMLESVKAFDGDVSDESMRIYGLVVDDHSRMDSFFYSAGFHCTQNNADGLAELAYTSATELDRITAYIDQLFTVFRTDAVTIAQDNRQLMREHRTALMVGSLANIREMDDTDYAPIPLPKLDSSQEHYKTIQNNGYDVWCVPISAADPELSGLIIEAFASSDYRSISPFYFDKYMKLRYSTDEICQQMFELVRSSIIYDFGRISQWNLNLAAEGPWRSCFYDYSLNVKYPENSFATKVQDNLKTAQTKLLELLASYRKYSNQNAQTAA